MLVKHDQSTYSWGDGPIYVGYGAKAKALRDGYKFLGTKAFRIAAHSSGVRDYDIECTVADFRMSTRDGSNEDENDQQGDINGENEVAIGYVSQEERRKLSSADFGWPAERKFPVVDQSHLDSAAKLLGRAPLDMQSYIKRRLIEIARRRGLKVPESWLDERQMKSDN